MLFSFFKPVVLAVLLIALAGCGVAPVLPSAGQVSGAQLQGREWVASYIDGIAAVTAPAPRLRWTAADQLSGSGGCNAFMGRAVVEQGALQLGPLAATGKACMTAPQGQEDRFFKALEATRSVRLQDGHLLLEDATGRVLARLTPGTTAP
ncbi:META domain-containing protein [Rhodoferax saidenbachensis]|uniref:Heat shock protein HslJ n=1 Tax=Rhodoferax saidenbachensis TaxID=1484693 RepID=A0ABU1ZT98_9BURK|nr:META domain-containing protein [Rhodoferax saidenbachensis]MDR7308777.1 heat shock protein HslJ [Rhodoferax saidenbachensis]